MRTVDREAIIGPYTIVLWRGVFRDRVTMRKDVWPALGGHMGTWRLKRAEAEAKFDELVAALLAELKPKTWQQSRLVHE